MKVPSLGESSWGDGLSSSAFFTGGDRPETDTRGGGSGGVYVGGVVVKKTETEEMENPGGSGSHLLPCRQSSSWSCWQEMMVSGNTLLQDCRPPPPWSQICDAYSCAHAHFYLKCS